MNLGELIRDYRLRHKLSQRKFADKCGNKITHAYISMLENNRNPMNGKPLSPSMEVYRAVADGMDMDIDDLIAILDEESHISYPPENDEDKDLWDLRDRLRRQPGMRILFQATEGASEEDLMDLVKIVEMFKRKSKWYGSFR